MGFQDTIKGFFRSASENSPEILVGLGVASLITAIFLAVRATPKAEELISEAEEKKGDSLTPVETIKVAAKPFVPTFVMAVTGTMCVAGGMKVKNNRHAELAATCAIAQGIVKRYEDKTEELVGKEKSDEIKKNVRKEVAQNPVVQESISRLPPSNIAGVHPFWDPLSNTPFYASTQMLEKAEVRLNKRLFTGLEPYITVEDLYDELNEQGVYPPLRHTAVSPMLGWTADRGGIEFDTDVDGVPLEQDHWDDGTPCYVMSFKNRRQPDYIR